MGGGLRTVSFGPSEIDSVCADADLNEPSFGALRANRRCDAVRRQLARSFAA